jgi:putative transposase
MDFFTVDTVMFKRVYVLFAIEHATRRARIVGVTEHQGHGQFRPSSLATGHRGHKDAVRAPGANAVAERFVRTARTECLDCVLVLGRHHLHAVLRTYIAHYNEQRPHRSLGLSVPAGLPAPPGPLSFSVRRRDVFGGLIHEYEPAAA